MKQQMKTLLTSAIRLQHTITPAKEPEAMAGNTLYFEDILVSSGGACRLLDCSLPVRIRIGVVFAVAAVI